MLIVDFGPATILAPLYEGNWGEYKVPVCTIAVMSYVADMSSDT